MPRVRDRVFSVKFLMWTVLLVLGWAAVWIAGLWLLFGWCCMPSA